MAREKKHQHMPFELIGWNEAKADLLFANPIFLGIGVGISRPLEYDYLDVVKDYLLENKIVITNDLVSKISKPEEFYPSLKGQTSITENLKDEGYVRSTVIPQIEEKGIGKIASISGRFYAMDRDKRWERVKKAYNAMVKGEGNKSNSAVRAIEESYQKEIFDEFVEPTVICGSDNSFTKIEKNDSVIFFNFRPDRARQITRALVDKDFKEFETENLDLYFVCFNSKRIALSVFTKKFKHFLVLIINI